METRKPNLILVHGGNSALGPISRLGLWNRFPTYTKGQIIWMLFAKALLVSSLFFYLLG